VNTPNIGHRSDEELLGSLDNRQGLWVIFAVRSNGDHYEGTAQWTLRQALTEAWKVLTLDQRASLTIRLTPNDQVIIHHQQLCGLFERLCFKN
jgi:hypothetical protein